MHNRTAPSSLSATQSPHTITTTHKHSPTTSDCLSTCHPPRALRLHLPRPPLQINQRTFVLRFGTFYTAYLIALPVVVTIFTFISPWVREYWVRTIDMTAQFIAPALMLFLIWPSKHPTHPHPRDFAPHCDIFPRTHKELWVFPGRLQKHFLVEGSFADADDSSASAMENFGAEGNRGLLGESVKHTTRPT